MEKKMKAAVVEGNCKIRIRQVDEPEIEKETQLKVHVSKGAICNTTDNKIYATDTPEKHWPNKPFPFILGHECTGRVVETGKAVKDIRVGDRIVYWSVDGGAFADYVILDTEQAAVGKISEEFPEDIAAMFEMVIGAGRLLFHEDGEALIRKGDKVAIFGLGPAGLIYHRLARMLGAGRVCGIGRRKLRLDTSLEVGADLALSSREENFEERVWEGLSGKPDVIIDATGGDVVKEMILLAKPETKIIAYGVPPFDWSVKKAELEKAGICPPEFQGVECARVSLRRCIDWAEREDTGLDRIITHRIPLEEIGRGLDMCRLERDSTLKVIVTVNE